MGGHGNGCHIRIKFRVERVIDLPAAELKFPLYVFPQVQLAQVMLFVITNHGTVDAYY